MDSRSFAKLPMRSSALLNIENDDKYCFLWSIFAFLHYFINIHPNGVSNYRQFFNELNIEGFEFTNGFRCKDVHKFEKIYNLSINIFEINFYQEQTKWRHKIIPIEVSEKNQIELLIY